MTKEEIWEKLETEFKLRGYSQKSIDTYKAGITTFLNWANKPYEDLDEEDFRNYLIHIIQEGKLKPQTINSNNSAIRFFSGSYSWKECQPYRTWLTSSQMIMLLRPDDNNTFVFPSQLFWRL